MSALPPEIVQDPVVDPHNPEHLKLGTLTYTKASLITLFLFLLWGDFCFSLMETVVPSVMTLKFNALQAPNWAIGLIVVSIPSLMTTIINPFASFRSDRFRSKWGRRIPFLAGATPFLVIFLCLLGFSEPISRFIQSALLSGKSSDLFVLLIVMGVLMVCFQFFNLFITSVYYYLFNDVVPRAFLARFMALFRIVGTGAGSFYNYFLLKYATTHMSEIFLGAALLYFVAFTLMCLKVKEGSYPPPPPNLGNETGLVAAIKTYAAECFTHRFYWIFFMANTAASMSWVTANFNVLVWIKAVGFDADFVGKVGGIAGLISMVLLYPAGILSDRFHPLRVLLVALAISFLMAPLGIAFIFMHDRFTLHTAQMIYIGLSAITLPIGTLAAAAEFPLIMKLLPQERYGQFCSANAMIRSFALVGGGFACGYFLDYVKRFGANPDDCYRFVPIWNLASTSFYLFFIYLLYREWKLLGGLTGYVPPSAKPPESVIDILEKSS